MAASNGDQLALRVRGGARGDFELAGLVCAAPGQTRFGQNKMTARVRRSATQKGGVATACRRSARATWCAAGGAVAAAARLCTQLREGGGLLEVAYGRDGQASPLLFVARPGEDVFDVYQWRQGDAPLPWAAAAAAAAALPRAEVHPRLLDTLAQSHPWAFGAIAELLHNAENNKAGHIAITLCPDSLGAARTGSAAPASSMLIVADDGDGLDRDGLRRMLRFGGHGDADANGTSRYGVGFKSGSMRLGDEAIVLTRKLDGQDVLIGTLSRPPASGAVDVLETPVFAVGAGESSTDREAQQLFARMFGINHNQLMQLIGALFRDGHGVVVIVRKLRTIDGKPELVRRDRNGRVDIELLSNHDTVLADVPARHEQHIDSGTLLDFDWRLREYCAIMFGGEWHRRRRRRCEIFFPRDERELERLFMFARAGVDLPPRFGAARVDQLALPSNSLKKLKRTAARVVASAAGAAGGVDLDDDIIDVPLTLGRLESLPEGACGVHIYWHGILIKPLYMPLAGDKVSRERISKVVGVCDVGTSGLAPLNNKQGFSSLTPGWASFAANLRAALLKYTADDAGPDGVGERSAQCKTCGQWRYATKIPDGWRLTDDFFCRMSKDDDGRAKTCETEADYFPADDYVEEVDGVPLGVMARSTDGVADGSAALTTQRRQSRGGGALLESYVLEDASDVTLGAKLSRDDDMAGQRPAAEVFAAQWHGGNIAVKLIDPECTQVPAKREFELMTRIHFPHIVQLFFMAEALEHNGDVRFAIGMELLDGYVPLESWLAQSGGVDDNGGMFYYDSAAVAIARQQAAALVYLHEKKLCHNDLHPGNVMVRVDHGKGTLGGAMVYSKLIDFGLTRYDANCDEPTARTSTPLHHGRGAFKAPEKVRSGSKWHPTREADVFSFGMLLRCLAIGSPRPCGDADNEQIVAMLAKKGTGDVLEPLPGVGARNSVATATCKRLDAEAGAACRNAHPAHRPTAARVRSTIHNVLTDAPELRRFGLAHGHTFCWHVINETHPLNYEMSLRDDAGIRPKGDDDEVSALIHVRSNPPTSPFISLSTDPVWSLLYLMFPAGVESRWERPRVIHKVDLARLKRGQVFHDLLDHQTLDQLGFMNNSVALNYARSAKEVLVHGSIEAEAIVERYVFNPKLTNESMKALTCFPGHKKPSVHEWERYVRQRLPGNMVDQLYRYAADRVSDLKKKNKNVRLKPKISTPKPKNQTSGRGTMRSSAETAAASSAAVPTAMATDGDGGAAAQTTAGDGRSRLSPLLKTVTSGDAETPAKKKAKKRHMFTPEEDDILLLVYDACKSEGQIDWGDLQDAVDIHGVTAEDVKTRCHQLTATAAATPTAALAATEASATTAAASTAATADVAAAAAATTGDAETRAKKKRHQFTDEEDLRLSRSIDFSMGMHECLVWKDIHAWTGILDVSINSLQSHWKVLKRKQQQREAAGAGKN